MSPGEHPLKSALLEEYPKIYERQPKRELQGYIDVEPAIPFVVENYPPSEGPSFPRVLVYASAENRHSDWLEGGYERCYDHGKRQTEKFRRVHIQPISNGDLLTVARYLLQKVADEPLPGDGPSTPCPFANLPGDFIEQIAVANYSKFALARGGKRKTKNLDPQDERLSSLHYVAKDLSILQPDILILPHTIYWKSVKKRWAELMGPDEKYLPGIIIGGPQVQPGPLNCLIPSWLDADLRATQLEDYRFRHAFPPGKQSSLKKTWISKCKREPGVATYLKWIDTWDSVPGYVGSQKIGKTHAFCKISGKP